MEAITYSLRNDAADSAQYYEDAAKFTDVVLKTGESLYRLIDNFRTYITDHHIEAVRSKEEYLFELLTLGTLWRVYCDDAHDMPDVPAKILMGLADLRKQGGSIKQGADFLKGIIATAFISPVDRTWYPRPTLDHLEKLLQWMAATGEFPQEMKRLRAWREFWCCKPDTASSEIGQAISFAEWFEPASEAALGKYTPNVEKFLNESQASHRWKEDVIFSGRRRVEYHLNMVGAEIMNRAFRDSFLAAKKKAVVLPACMRYHPKPICKAVSNGLSCECTGCTPQCRVNQLTKMGKKFGFEVFLVPHESSVFSGDAGKQLIGEGAGIVGIACVSNLVAGGWKAKALGMPPQCVLLDHCGCRKHWHEKGISTDIDMKQLRHVLNLENMAEVST